MVNMLPANAVQYARFQLGNSLTNMFGFQYDASSVRTERMSDSMLDVLRAAVENARKDGRQYVNYSDYPAMKDGTRPENFYKGDRLDQSSLDLYLKSATDPVFETFTLVGGFNFKDNFDGGFSIDDHYGFDRNKSLASKRHDPKDVYSELVYDAQDVDQTYNFNIKGSVPPAGKPMEGYEYLANMVRGAYNSVADTFRSAGEITTNDVPLEFIALAREKLNNFFKANPMSSFASFDELDMPEALEMPDVMNYMAAVKDSVGGYNIIDKMALAADEVAADLLDIDIKIPKVDRMIGNIPDVSIDLAGSFPKLPTALLSNNRLEQMKEAINTRLYGDNPDEMAFGEAFAKYRAEGAETFNWRGNSYTTQYKEEVNGDRA